MFYADHQPRCPAGHYKVSVINLPSRSTTLTCRHTELIHLYYTQLKPKYQLEFRVISKGFAASSHIFQTPIRILQELIPDHPVCHSSSGDLHAILFPVLFLTVVWETITKLLVHYPGNRSGRSHSIKHMGSAIFFFF